MSKARKFVKDNALHSFPTPSDSQQIAQVTELRGSNICEVVNADGEKMLVRLPAKFHKVIWVGRGDYLIIEPMEAKVKMQSGEVKASITHVLYKDQIQHLKSLSLWPLRFTDNKNEKTKQSAIDDFEYSSSEDEDGNFVNPNHVGVEASSSEDKEYSF